MFFVKDDHCFDWASILCHYFLSLYSIASLLLNYSYSLIEESIFFAYRNSNRDLRALFSSFIDFSLFFLIIFFIIQWDLLAFCKISDVMILTGFLVFNFLAKDFLSFFHSSYLRYHSFRNCNFYYEHLQLKIENHIFLNSRFEIEVHFANFSNYQFIYFWLQWFLKVSYYALKVLQINHFSVLILI